MASKKKILDELQDVVEAVQEAQEEGPEGVLIPGKVVESLLVSEGMSNKGAVTLVCQQIREIAQEQMPKLFPG